MTTTMRRRRLSVAIAIAVPLVLMVVAAVSWMDAGIQPVEDQTVLVPLPDNAR